MLRFSIVSWLRGHAKSAPNNGSCEGSAAQDVNKICAKPARESDLEVKIVKAPWVRSTFGSWAPQNLHHACAQQRFGSENRWKLAWPEHFWNLGSAKFAPISKSKSLKLEGCGALLEVELRKICTTPAPESDLEVKIVNNWRSRDVFWSWNCFSMFEADDAESVEGLQISCYGNATLQGSFCVAVSGVRMSRLNFLATGAVLWKHPNRSNVLEFWGQVSGQHVIFEGSLAKTLCFWSSKLHVWRKSHRNASFLSFKTSFWKKSRTKASFLSFKASFLKVVLHKSFVFELQSFHFWRKSRTKASFLSFKASVLKEVSQKSFFLKFRASFLKEVSHKSFVCELQSIIFEGGLAQKLCFSTS